jgi:SAM-dependent methyltransferase
MNTESDLLDLLGCPKCHMALRPAGKMLSCPGCAFRIEFADGVAVADGRPAPSFFDDRFEIMREGHANDANELRMCYEQQMQYIQPFLQERKVVMDVGCGPGIRYSRGSDCRIVGLEPSFQSIRANNDVDLRVCGNAGRMPFINGAADAIICFYSVHHMIGRTVAETRANVRATFEEFARVLKPGGDLFVCEMNPGPLSAFSQRVFWNVTKIFLREKLDQFFWSARELARLGEEVMPKSHLRQVTPQVSPWMMITPIFSLPWLKIPRILFPFQSRLFHWTSSTNAARVPLAA